MLLRTSKLERSRLTARDGRIGKIMTFLFDEEQWVLRYIVAKHGFLFLGRHVLISPMSVAGTIRDGEAIAVNLTQEQIKNAPDADLAKSVSRKMETEFLRYYRVPVYWGGAGLWGGALTPLEAGALSPTPANEEEPRSDLDPDSDDESHLRSTREVSGYHLYAQGSDVGVITDFAIEDTTWAVRYLRVEADDDTGGGSLYISPHWVQGISWADQRVSIDIPLARLKDAPKVGIKGAPSRDEEERLHEFFGKARYWK